MIVYELDGRNFSTLEEFAEEFSRVVLRNDSWQGNLDAFNDILRGVFGTPEDGFTLRWSHHHLSRERLGYAETVRQLELRLGRCHPANRHRVAAELALARNERGPTVFDWLIEIVEAHGAGGAESDDNVSLELL